MNEYVLSVCVCVVSECFTVTYLTVCKNEREKLRNAQLIIKMAGHSTFISNPADLNGEPRKFEFDYSYWSHDHFVEQDDGYLAPKTEEYADQVGLYSRIEGL